MVHLGPVDIGIVLAYVAGVVFIGIRASRGFRSDADQFLLAGRNLTLPIFVATLVSTWYGGILGVGEFSWRFGISNWVVFGLPYYAFALVFALFLAARIRATSLVTIPDKLEQSYDRRTAVMGGVLAFVLVTPAAYVLMLGILTQLIFGWSLAFSVVLMTVLTTIYLFNGGLRSDVWVNAFEFVLMFLGFAVMAAFLGTKYGGLAFIRANVPALHLTWSGGNSWQYILVWFFIALWTLVDPAFHQRCYAAQNPQTARNGILVSILFWLVFDFLTTVSGLYARALLPGLKEPMYAYPELAEVVLPTVAKGLFYVGMLATIMSTLSSLTLISAITIGHDIVGRLSSAATRERRRWTWSKWGVVIAAAVSTALALAIPSVVALWYTIGTCIIPGLLVPLIASYFRPLTIPARYAFTAMMSGWIVSTTCLVSGHILSVDGVPHYPLGVEPMIPGLVLSVLVWAAGRYAHRASPA